MQAVVIITIFAAAICLSLFYAPRRVSVASFFGGLTDSGKAPNLWVLVLSQVTTWIFARSLMNAAILGFYYGIAGTLAYAAYYGSFLTGGFIVSRMRAQGARSVQDWLAQRFGTTGTAAYNLVVALRLLSEVFANLLVVGLIFSATLPDVAGIETIAIVVVGLVALGYSAWGGLSAALRTDVVQMLFFLVVFGAAFLALILRWQFDLGAVLTAPGAAGPHNGWVLLLVAGLQVFSYPVHDPVMMDRGFVADPATTRRSFVHAFWISSLCIIAFGFFGIQGSLEGAAYEGELLGTWAAMLPGWVYVLLIVSLLVSALSTLDSALSSAARLVVEELCLAPRSLLGGRIAMLVFAAAGGALTLWDSKTLFDAVAVSGTASMFLTPVLIAGLLGARRVALWAYLTSFAAAMVGAAIYIFRDLPPVAALLYEGHKYEQLLQICLLVLLVGFTAVACGSRRVEAGQAG
jgi:Na+/proline symporter